MVPTIEVTYPNGRMPTSVSTIPAKIIKIHALTKNNGPAAMSLKKPCASWPLSELTDGYTRYVASGKSTAEPFHWTPPPATEWAASGGRSRRPPSERLLHD
jgi:hypothetical protein